MTGLSLDAIRGVWVPFVTVWCLGQAVELNWAATLENQQSECAPSEDSDQPGHPPSLIRVFAVRMKKAWVLSYPLSAQQRRWSDWADAQADLSLRWAHTHFVGFVMSWLSCIRSWLLPFHLLWKEQMSRLMTKPTKWHVRPAKTQISLCMKKWLSLQLPEDSDPTGWMARLIWVLAGSKGHFVGFVLLRLKLKSGSILHCHLLAQAQQYGQKPNGTDFYLNLATRNLSSGFATR